MEKDATQPYIQLITLDAETAIRCRQALEELAFELKLAFSYGDALSAYGQYGLPHLVLVDYDAEPGASPYEFGDIVHSFSDLPLIALMAAAHAEEVPKVLATWAEDCMVKPIYRHDLLFRVRRTLNTFAIQCNGQPTLPSDLLTVDYLARRVVGPDGGTTLSPLEAKLLHIFTRYANRNVTLEYLHRRLGMATYTDSTLRKYVSNLRRKLKKVTGQRCEIQTRYGVGYRFVWENLWPPA